MGKLTVKLAGKAEKKLSMKPKKKDIVKKAKQGNVSLFLKAEPVKVAAKVKYVMPSKYAVEEKVAKCLDALYKLEESFKRGKLLFDINTTIFAEIHCIKIPKNLGNVNFVLPHPTITENQEISMVIADEKRNASDYYEDITNKTRVKTVIPLRELRKNYDQFELQRRLLTQQDLLLIDTRVYNHAAHVLGKRFRKNHNMFIPVRFNKNNIEKSIDVGMRTTVMRLSEGETSIVTVGNITMDRDHVKDNILSMVQQLKKFPGGEANIRAINIKLPKSMSLPLYLTLRPSNTVDVPKAKHSKPKCSSAVEGELSTIPGATVSVFPDGTVKVHREKKNEEMKDEEDDSEIDEDIMNDEQESKQKVKSVNKKRDFHKIENVQKEMGSMKNENSGDNEQSEELDEKDEDQEMDGDQNDDKESEDDDEESEDNDDD